MAAKPADVSEDGILGGRLVLRQPLKGHRVGHDAVLLAAATSVGPGDRAVELGAGVGAAGLAVARRVDDLAVTLVEIEPTLTALVFKIQANMDPNHRDRIAFARICSGRLRRGMRLKQVRTGKQIPLHAPQFFFARERELAEEAFAGDVVGIPNHGTLRIGDTLTDGEDLSFVGVPYFAPEILRRVRLDDAMKAKKLRQALDELAEEGVVQLFRPVDGSAPLVGVVGSLQLDVLQARLAAEYGVGVGFEQPPFALARWVSSTDRAALDRFLAEQRASIANDLDGDPVYLATSAFMMRRTAELAPAIMFRDIKDIRARTEAA